MDAINAKLWETITDDAGVQALVGADALNGGAWNMRADDGTPLPLVKFQLLAPGYEYSFGGIAARRYPYLVTAHTEDTEERTGAETASLLTEALEAALLDAEFEIAGHELLLCRPYAGTPPDCRQGAHNRDEYSQGLLVEIIITPN